MSPALKTVAEGAAHDVLKQARQPESELPQPATRPYPASYNRIWVMKDGAEVLIRPIRPEDEPLMVRFHQTLSGRSVFFRYFHMLDLSQRIAHERLARICFIDYDHELALVAERRDPQTGSREIIAVARLTRLPGSNDAEIAFLVSDLHQNCGLGSQLARMLLDIGRQKKITRLLAEVLPENRAMQQVFNDLGFRLRHSLEDGVVKAEITL
jgi:acetyltransferase